jgi:UDP-4-amino-4,6-dideoxy-N-acetyl-beta-L-altrosamine transaminase
MIPYSCQNIDSNDIEAVVKVLQSDWITQGPAVERFEDAVARRCENEHAVAVSNATAALHIACLSLGVGEGDTVWTSPITYVASANCARYCGASVDFVDIDPNTFNICPVALEQKLQKASDNDKLPKVVIAVDMAGAPCELETLKRICGDYDIYLVEDASHAIGATYAGRPIGSSDYADIVIFSFHPVKNITTGEGGMALTRDAELAHRMRLFRSHGITRDPGELTRNASQAWYFEQQELGYNYRLTDIQAALGISQLDRLDDFIAARNRLALAYDEALVDLPLNRQLVGENRSSAYHLYIVRLDGTRTGMTRSEVFAALRERGVGVNVHYIPVHTHPYYEQLGFRAEDFPNSMAYYSECLSLPLFPHMTVSQQTQVSDALHEVLI